MLSVSFFSGEPFHIKRKRVLVVFFFGGGGWGEGLVPLRAFSLKRFTARAFTVLFRLLRGKSEAGDDVLF